MLAVARSVLLLVLMILAAGPVAAAPDAAAPEPGPDGGAVDPAPEVHAGAPAPSPDLGRHEGPDAGQKLTGVEPPKLLESAEAEYPPGAAAAGTEGVVALRLSIDADGRVIEAEVIEPAGHGFDEAAHAAALRLRFEPAKRNGQPVAARIRYTYAFKLKPPTPPAPPALPPTEVRGTVVHAQDGKPIAEASIALEPGAPGAAPVQPIRSDSHGRFRIVGLEPGRYRLSVSAPRLEPTSVKVDVTAGAASDVNVHLKPAAPPPPEALTDVTVRGKSAAQRLRESALAVNVVELKREKHESADLGEVVARNVGISLRRTGGLGSGARFCLNGLCEEQIRFFIDGVPLEIAGYSLGIQNVPVNFVERLEVYRGVVPVKFGNDALGGAVNLITEELRGTRATASVQLGSFGIYRLTAAARHTHAATGLHASFNAFRDHGDNDYKVDVEVPDDRGRLSPARVHRFHDAYDAYGGRFDVGVVDRPWAKRLTLRLHATRAEKDIQNNFVMSVPYGEVGYSDGTKGAVLQYEQPRLFGSAFGTALLLSASRTDIDFKDLSRFVYDWFGRRIRERVRPGELGPEPSDEHTWQHAGFARGLVSYTFSPTHSLHLAVAPTLADRSGRDRLITMGRDPLSAERRYFRIVSGLEYQAELFDRRLEVLGFGKSYLLDTSSEESLPGGLFRRLEQDSHTLGFGEMLRFRLARSLWAKCSYERATRLPSPYELFGNGVLILANLRLVPERSHNGNLSLTLDAAGTRFGDFRAEVNGFLRHTQNQIVLLGNDMVFSYQNVYTARSQGVETSAGWTSPGGHLLLDGNVTWQSLRNRSDSGTFRDFKGDRIPNRPWLFANLTARLQKTDVSAPRDELSLSYYLRYVHEFFRGWESLGLREFKQVVPSQTTHSLALTYVARGAITQTWTAEIMNITDAKAFDFFGLQRPGRAFFVKVTAEY